MWMPEEGTNMPDQPSSRTARLLLEKRAMQIFKETRGKIDPALLSEARRMIDKAAAREEARAAGAAVPNIPSTAIKGEHDGGRDVPHDSHAEKLDTKKQFAIALQYLSKNPESLARLKKMMTH